LANAEDSRGHRLNILPRLMLLQILTAFLMRKRLYIFSNIQSSNPGTKARGFLMKINYVSPINQGGDR